MVLCLLTKLEEEELGYKIFYDFSVIENFNPMCGKTRYAAARFSPAFLK